MISVVIIEDDLITSDLLVSMLQETHKDVEIKAVIRSVQEGVNYFKSYGEIDLIFSDIQLTDGLSFSIFEKVKITCPIIFISSYDQYLINAFEYSGIDYIIKPFTKENLLQALKKYNTLKQHFSTNNPLKIFLNEYGVDKKTRIIVKKGASYVSLLLSDVVLFYTENLVVYVLDSKGIKYLIDKSLNLLENELDKRKFFRVNRQYILNINYIQAYKNYERVKLLISLTLKETDHLIIVGQEKAKLFRQWMSEA